MARTVSTDIFELIKSLSTGEKRYFKLYSALGNTNMDAIYIRLFDSIDGQASYDEQRVMKEIPEAKQHQLSNQKKHLSDLIIESLRLFHSQNTVDARLQSSISEIEVLFSKRLFKHCLTEIEKAKSLSIRYEKLLQLGQLLDWEEKILCENFSFPNWKVQMNKVAEDKGHLAKAIGSLIEYQGLMNRVTQFFQKGWSVNYKETKREMEEILQHNFFRKNILPSSFIQRYYHRHIQSTCFFGLKQLEKSLSMRRKMLDDFSSDPDMRDANLPFFVSAVNSYIFNCIELQKEYDLEAVFSKSIEVINNSPHSKSPDMIVRTYTLYLGILAHFINSGKFSNGAAFVAQMEDSFHKYEDKIKETTQIIFSYMCALIYFGAGDSKRCLFWTNRILNRKSEVREDIQIFTRILNLMLQFDLKKRSDLEYQLRSTERFLSKRNNGLQVEKLMVNFIGKKAPLANSKKELHLAFADLKKKIEELYKNENERAAEDYFDFISWTESKLENISFEEAAKRTAKKRAGLKKG